MTRLTANEARTIAGKTLDEKIDSLLVAIKEHAENKHRSLKTGWEYKEDPELWIHGGYSRTENWENAVNVLRNLGFTVDFIYEEKQFVDMYTLISW